MNFGRHGWKKTPVTSNKVQPIDDMGYRTQIEQAMSDLLFAVDLKINGIIWKNSTFKLTRYFKIFLCAFDFNYTGYQRVKDEKQSF